MASSTADPEAHHHHHRSSNGDDPAAAAAGGRVDAIADRLQTLKPEQVFVTYAREPHPDHVAAAALAGQGSE